METVINGSDALLLALDQELQLLVDLIGFAHEKESLLIRADVEGLNGVILKEEETVIALHEKEEERKVCVGALAEVLCPFCADPTLRKLAEHIDDPEYRQRLVGAGNAIEQAIKRLSRNNVKVKGLLRHHIRYTGFMLSLLCSNQNKMHYYNVQGNREDKMSLKSRLDYHA